MLLQYFGLKEEPFGVSPDPRRLFLSQTHREALEGLQSGFSSNRGFTAMIAPPGMGKTTLLFRFLEQIRETARVVFLFDMDSTCEPREFVAYILRDLGIVPAQGSAEMHDQLSEVLVQENQAGRRFVIVIDEAQNLSDAVLERVRLLTNFESSKGKLIQVVLSGQPQLSDKLLQGSLLQLRQRISTVCHIKSLSIEETIGYINYRVKMAGYLGQPLFTEGAMRLIAQASQGTPRTINNLCFNALTLCCKLKSKEVDIAMVAKVISALQLIPPSREPYVSPAAVAAPFASVSAPSVPSAAANLAPEQSRKRKEFAGLQLTPQSSEPVGARTEAARTEAARPVGTRTNDSAAASVDQTTQRPWKRKEFSGLQLTPQSGDHIAATSDQKPDQPAEQKFWQRTKLRVLHLFPATAGTVMLWVPAAAVILVMSFVGVLRLTEVFSPASLTSDVNQTTEMSVPPPTDTDEPATKSVPSPSTSDHSVNNPASATAPAPAATPRPMQATATIPKPSPITVLPASPAARPAHAAASVPTHSAVTTSSSRSKSSQGNPSASLPSAATQPVVTAPKTNAQPSSTSSVTTPVAPQQSQTPATPAPKQVRAALSGNAPAPATVAHSATTPSVHAALPQP